MTYEEKIDLLTKEAERVLKEKHPEANKKEVERWADPNKKGWEGPRINIEKCVIEGCDKPQRAECMCRSHYDQKYNQYNNPYRKYYFALFGNRNYFTKCKGDGVYRQIGRW